MKKKGLLESEDQRKEGEEIHIPHCSNPASPTHPPNSIVTACFVEIGTSVAEWLKL